MMPRKSPLRVEPEVRARSSSTPAKNTTTLFTRHFCTHRRIWNATWGKGRASTNKWEGQPAE